MFLSWQRMEKRTHGNMEEEHTLANIAQVAQGVLEAYKQREKAEKKALNKEP